jgi:hypothetical protein
LWKLSPNLIHTHTGAFSKQHVPYIKPWKVCKRLGLKGYQNLLKLVGVLRLKGYHTLADSVEDLLQEWVGHQGSSEGGELLAFSQKHMRNMAIAVANAIGCKLPLRLGCLVDPDGSEQEYSAIFVWDNEKAKSLPQTSFAFTAARGSSSGSSVDYANDIDRHVSLEVDAECLTDGRRPELRIKSWRNGLYFVSVWQREVLFPWPASFQSFTGFTSSDIVS